MYKPFTALPSCALLCNTGMENCTYENKKKTLGFGSLFEGCQRELKIHESRNLSSEILIILKHSIVSARKKLPSFHEAQNPPKGCDLH